MSAAGAGVRRRCDLEHPLLRSRTGRGVRIAVLDSGVTPDHPHVGEVAGGFALHRDGTVGDDFHDRLGHGTAVYAVIREKALQAEILPVRIFEDRLQASSDTLLRAIDFAVEKGAHLINLSLGTENLAQLAALRSCVRHARGRGALVVSPSRHRDRRWLPGDLVETAGVESGPNLERHEIETVSDTPVRFYASPLPRPVPGVPAHHNLSGVSFAAANVTGVLARLAESEPDADWQERIALLAGAAGAQC
jgi:hypothetical protein